jgi:hypothetical protein
MNVWMRRTIMLFTCTLLVLSAGRSDAFIRFTQNEFITGESLDPGMTQMGVFFTLGDDYQSFYPAVRFGLGSLLELGVRFGATSANFDSGDELGGLLGMDLKYQVIKQTEEIPVDMALDLGLDNTIINNGNATELTFSSIFSRGFPLTDWGYKIVPYGGLEMSALYGSLIPDNTISFYVDRMEMCERRTRSRRLGDRSGLQFVSVPRGDSFSMPSSRRELIFLGRNVCVAKKPKCPICVLNKICPSAFTFG